MAIWHFDRLREPQTFDPEGQARLDRLDRKQGRQLVHLAPRHTGNLLVRSDAAKSERRHLTSLGKKESASRRACSRRLDPFARGSTGDLLDLAGEMRLVIIASL